MEDEKLLPKVNKHHPESPDPGGAVPQTFRAGVGAMIVNRDGLVLLLERRDRPGSWQMAQGGLDPGEAPEESVLREVKEETGIDPADLQMIAAVDRLLAYELPQRLRTAKTGIGQVQYWFIFRFTGSDEMITLGDKKEFKDKRWVSMDEAVNRVVDFKKPVYRELAEYYRSIAGRAEDVSVSGKAG
jgi:putative (di)nucleoside polyphosphate hydrolase